MVVGLATVATRAGQGAAVLGVQVERYVSVTVTVCSDADLKVEAARGFRFLCCS